MSVQVSTVAGAPSHAWVREWPGVWQIQPGGPPWEGGPYSEGPKATLLCGDALERLRELPDGCISCVVTSPPYWGLRDYGTATWVGGDSSCDHIDEKTSEANTRKFRSSSGGDAATTLSYEECLQAAPQKANTTRVVQYREVCEKCGAQRVDKQLGLEKTPEEFVETLVGVFREVRRVLHPTGTLWVVLGFSFFGTGAGQTNTGKAVYEASSWPQERPKKHPFFKSKDCVPIPWMFTMAMIQDGWYFRAPICWKKPTCLPAPVKDRVVLDREEVLLFAKNERYFYDYEGVKVPAAQAGKTLKYNGTQKNTNHENRMTVGAKPGTRTIAAKRHLRAVWEDLGTSESVQPLYESDFLVLNPQPFPGSHYATYPEKLVRYALLAGTSRHGACSACGAQWAPVYVDGEPDEEWKAACGADSNGEYLGQAQKDYEEHKAQDASAVKARILAGMKERRLSHWVPTCKCPGPPPVRPPFVLDPFSGAGTSLLVAIQLGCDSVGIDLDPGSHELAIPRISKAAMKILHQQNSGFGVALNRLEQMCRLR